MQKRGQLTVFIIIGLVIILAFALIYQQGHSNKEVLEGLAGIEAQAESVKAFVQGCVDSVSADALIVAGLQGGYAFPENYVSDFLTRISYLYDNGTGSVPSKEAMELELAKYFKKHINSCILDFAAFGVLSGDIRAGTPSADIEFGETNVIFRISYPITYEKLGIKREMKEFIGVHNIRLEHIRQTAERLVKEIVADPDFVRIATLDSPGLNITIEPYFSDTLVYVIQDSKSGILPGHPYIFQFATKIAVEKYFNIENYSPKITNIRPFQIKSGELFSYKIEAVDKENDRLTFSAMTTLFDINPATGAIEFTAPISAAGMHNIPIFVEDSKGGHDTGYLPIKIIK